jgi:hypothetical protein
MVDRNKPKTWKVRLTEGEATEVYSWLSDRIDELEPDRDSIDEESPGLFGALLTLRDALIQEVG